MSPSTINVLKYTIGNSSLCDYVLKCLNSPIGHSQMKSRSKPSRCETEI